MTDFPEPNGQVDLTAIFNAIRHIDQRQSKFEQLIGTESPDGKGGTGLVGEVRRMNVQVIALVQDRNLLRGGLAAVVGSAVLLVMGVKYWIGTVVEGAK